MRLIDADEFHKKLNILFYRNVVHGTFHDGWNEGVYATIRHMEKQPTIKVEAEARGVETLPWNE